VDVASAVADYLMDQGHIAKRSLIQYRQRLQMFAAWCGQQHVTLEQVNNRSVQAFLEHLREHSAPSKHDKSHISSRTVGNYALNIIVFLRWCLRDEEYAAYVTLARVSGVRMPRQDKVLKESYTDKEIAALFEACAHPKKRHEYQLRDTALLSLLLDTGIRAGELRTLTIGNVTLATDPREDSYIKVMGKGRKEREIPIGAKTRRQVARYIRGYRQGAKKTDPLFISRQGDTQMVHSGLKDILLRLKKFSSLPEDAQVNPHKFRHTFASRFMQKGGDIYTLSRLLGHSSVVITEHYLTTLGVDIGRVRSVNYISIVDGL
jgi:site-specific recombinase XerD